MVPQTFGEVENDATPRVQDASRNQRALTIQATEIDIPAGVLVSRDGGDTECTVYGEEYVGQRKTP